MLKEKDVSNNQYIGTADIYLDDKVDEFIDWYYKNMVKGNYTDIGEFHKPNEMRNFIEKMAVWYELRYPDYEIIKSIIGGIEDEIPNETIENVLSNLDDGIPSDLKENKNAETKHHPNSVATGAAGLLRRMSAGRSGTKIRCTTKKLKGDACLHRYDGGANTAWYQSEGQ